MENMHTDVMLLRVRLLIVSFILATLLFDLGVKHKRGNLMPIALRVQMLEEKKKKKKKKGSQG